MSSHPPAHGKEKLAFAANKKWAFAHSSPPSAGNYAPDHCGTNSYASRIRPASAKLNLTVSAAGPKPAWATTGAHGGTTLRTFLISSAGRSAGSTPAEAGQKLLRSFS